VPPITSGSAVPTEFRKAMEQSGLRQIIAPCITA
jgi:hypothetical protein